MSAKHGRRVGRLAVVGVVLGGLFALPGCYSNWPPVEGYGQTELNNASTRGVLAASGRWALQRYKTPGPVAFNLPAGLRRSGVLEVISAIGGGAVALTEETAGGTVYHLSRINLTNDTAEVDVIVPTGQGASGTEYQMTQLRLTGRGSAWKVVVVREWETLVRPVPELTYLPATEYPAQDENAPPKPWKDSTSSAGEGGEGGEP
jgi:hypothetical protein